MNSPHTIRASDFLAPTLAALVSVIINYGGTFVIIIQAAKVAGLNPDQTASWVWSMSIGIGITGVWLSYRYREPIITAWSTPGAAFLVSALAFTPYPEAIGAYILSALAFVALGLSGWFERVVRLIPPGVAAGLLAGILLQFGIAAFGGAKVDPITVAILVIAYAFLRRIAPRFAIIGVLILGLALVLFQGRLDINGLDFHLAGPIVIQPEFSIKATLGVAVPLFLITLSGQYMPGMLVLRNDGFKTSANPILIATGLGSMILAPLGSHAFNVAAISAAICTGANAHDDPSKRYIAGIICGSLYIAVGLFGVTFVTLFLALPATFVSTLAGLALLGTIGSSLANAVVDPAKRETALIAFTATAANITLFSIGGAFWGLVIGLTAHVIMHADFSAAPKISISNDLPRN